MLLGILLEVAPWLVRIPAVHLATARSTGFACAGRALIAIALPRGMAAGVLAAVPSAGGMPATGEIAAIVLACIMTTIVMFTSGLPIEAWRADLARVGANAPLATTSDASATAPSVTVTSEPREPAPN